MLSKKRRGAAPTTTPNNIHLNESYQNYALIASENLKEKIAELLLFLQKPLPRELEMDYWGQFKTRLSQFYDLPESRTNQ